MDVAPIHKESLVYDENTLPMETESGPKPIEILPLFNASKTQAASVIESETHIHSQDSQKQTCIVNVCEITPIIVSEVEQIETVGTKQRDKATTPVQLSTTLVTSSAMISDQVVPCDNLNTLEMNTVPHKVMAEPSSIPHESTIVYEQVATIKEDNLKSTFAPNLQQAHAIFSSLSPIEIQEIDTGERERDLPHKSKPTTHAATCTFIANTALSTEETLLQNVSTKLYPETFIATEEATPKYIEQLPYQTQQVCTAETGRVFDTQDTPTEKHAQVAFSKLQAIIMQESNVHESETFASHAPPIDLLAMAKDTITLHNELGTDLNQAIDSVLPSEPITYTRKKAQPAVEEMSGKLTETLNVFESETEFDTSKPFKGSQASSSYTPKESFSISEVFVQEHDEKFHAVEQTLAKAIKSHETLKAVEQSKEQLLETTHEYRRKEMEPLSNAQMNFELQKSVVRETTLTHESEKQFDTKLHSNEPQYHLDSQVNSSIVVSEVQMQEQPDELRSAALVQAEAVRSQELHKTYEQYNEQMLDTISEYRAGEKHIAYNAQINFDLQRSAVGELVVANEVEAEFETKLTVNEPHYLLESTLQCPIMVSETQIQESSDTFSPERIIPATVGTAQEVYKAPVSIVNQILEFNDDFQTRSKQTESKAQVAFKLQKSAISETVIAHESELKFETHKQENKPHYTVTPMINSSLDVIETQVADSESLLTIKANQVQNVQIIDYPKQVSHVSEVVETIPYDSTEHMKSGIENEVSAKQTALELHEVSVEMATATEPLAEIERFELAAQKKAAPSVTTNIALNISMETSTETLGQLEQSAAIERLPIVQFDLAPGNSITVIKAETFEQSEHLDREQFKAALPTVSTSKHEAIYVAESWPLEISADVQQSAKVFSDQTQTRTITQTTAVQVSTVTASDTIKDLADQLPKQVKPKYSVNKHKGILTEYVVSQENTEQMPFIAKTETVEVHMIDNVDIQRRCQQVEQCTFESAQLIEATKSNTVISTKTVSDALIAARVEEVITTSSEERIEDIKPITQYVKTTQENFNVICESEEHVLLESENRLSISMPTKEQYPNKLVEGIASYSTDQVEPFEKEKELNVSEHKETFSAKASTEQPLTIANTSEDIILANVDFDISTSVQRSQAVISTAERLLEGVSTTDVSVQEMSSDFISSDPKTSRAKPLVDFTKPLQVESVAVLESEAKLETERVEQKRNQQKHEDFLQAATLEISQVLEQIGHREDVEVVGNQAKMYASEINQNIAFENVYLQEHKHEIASAVRNETPTHAVKVIERYPLYKETSLVDNQTEKLLTQPIFATQEATQFESAHKQSEINTLVNIKSNKRIDQITNKQIIKQASTSAQSQLEGRWYKRNLTNNYNFKKRYLA